MAYIDDEARKRWRSWVEKEIGGPLPRMDLIMAVVSDGIGQRKSPDEIAASARQAAAGWDAVRGLNTAESMISSRPTRVSSVERRWRRLMRSIFAS